MQSKTVGWLTKKPVLGLLILGVVFVNWVSWNHAWRMTHFTVTGVRTKAPEDLTTLEKIPLLLLGITVPRPQNHESPADYGIAFEAISVQSGEHQLEGWLVPASTEQSQGTVLLFHGYAGAKDSMLAEAKALHEMGFTTLLIDFRGSGDSTGNKTTVGYEEAEDVISTLQFAQNQKLPSPIFLYGQSMGGAAVMRAVATADIQPDGIIIEAVFDEMLSTVENRFDAMGVPSFPAAQLLVFWGGVQSGFNGFDHNPADYAEQITVPALMLHGENDPRATLEQGQRLFGRLASSDKKIVVFEDAKHEASIDVDRETWKAEVGRFLRGSFK